MTSFVQLLAFGAGAFFLGIAMVLALLFTAANRHSPNDSFEGCFGNFLVLVALGVAVSFFYWAIQVG